MKLLNRKNCTVVYMKVMSYILVTSLLLIGNDISYSQEKQEPPKKVTNKLLKAAPSEWGAHPVTLRVVYADDDIVPGDQGEMHSGNATYVFKIFCLFQ